jgi:hypothetical protein
MSEITFNWQVQNMTHTTDTGFVINVAWGCTASQDSASAFHGGKTVYENNPDQDGFIPYDQLTEEQVLGWVWADVDKAAIEADLTTKIEKQLNPTTTNGLPWSN